MLTFFFPVESKDCMKSASYEYAHWNATYLLENLSPEDHKNVVD